MSKRKKLTRPLLNMMSNENFNERIIIVLRDKNIVKKIKPTKPNQTERKKYVKNVRSINKNSHRNLKRFIRNNNGRDIKSMDFLNIISFRGNKSLVEKLSRRRDVAKIDIENYMILPEEELYTSNKTIKNNFQKLWNHEMINHNNENSTTVQNSTIVQDITVSILDTGIDVNHKEFTDIVDLSRSKSFIRSEKSVVDYNGHGTHVAGIIGGRTVGICKDIKIMSVKCYNKKGIGSTNSLIQGIEYSIINEADVIQLFLNKDSDLDYKNGLDVALRKSLDVGIHVCVSIEKSLNDMYKQIKTAGIIDKKGNKFGNKRRFYAPGIGVWSSDINNKYKYLNGISMSTAHLTGLIASILQIKQNVFPWNIRIKRNKNFVIDKNRSCCT